MLLIISNCKRLKGFFVELNDKTSTFRTRVVFLSFSLLVSGNFLIKKKSRKKENKIENKSQRDVENFWTQKKNIYCCCCFSQSFRFLLSVDLDEFTKEFQKPYRRFHNEIFLNGKKNSGKWNKKSKKWYF